MKYNQYRVGNIISHDDYSYELFVIDSFTNEDGRLVAKTLGGKNGIWHNPIHMLTPILITDEILDFLKIDAYFQIVFPDIKFLHQFQNHYFETHGEEMKIDLNGLRKLY